MIERITLRISATYVHMILPGRNGRVLRGSSRVVPQSEDLGEPGSSRTRVRLRLIWRRAIDDDAGQIRITALALRKH